MAQPLKQTTQGRRIDGLWTAEFGSTADMFGSGVIVFRDGKILGGDATHFYVGEYKLSGNDFEATIRVSPFIDGAESIFGTRGQDLTLGLKGSLTAERQAIAQGQPQGMPNVRFGLKLTKRS